MTIAEPGADGIVALKIPTLNFDAGELFGSIAAILVAEDIALADVGSAWGCGTQYLGVEIAFVSIFPDDTKFVIDELNILGFSLHKAQGLARVEIIRKHALAGTAVE